MGDKGQPSQMERCVQRGTAAWTNPLGVRNYKCFRELPRKHKVGWMVGRGRRWGWWERKGWGHKRCSHPCGTGASALFQQWCRDCERPDLYFKMPLCGKVTIAVGYSWFAPPDPSSPPYSVGGWPLQTASTGILSPSLLAMGICGLVLFRGSPEKQNK